MYKIQLGFEDGLYVAYLFKQNLLEDTHAETLDELVSESFDDLLILVSQLWDNKLTQHLNN